MSEFSSGAFQDVSKEEQIRRLHEAVSLMVALVGGGHEIQAILDTGDKHGHDATMSGTLVEMPEEEPA